MSSVSIPEISAKEKDCVRFRRYYEANKELVKERMRMRYYERRAKQIEAGEIVVRPQGRPRKTMEQKVADLLREEKMAMERVMNARTVALNRVVA